jgi:multiple sugar transport system permease protein
MTAVSARLEVPPGGGRSTRSTSRRRITRVLTRNLPLLPCYILIAVFILGPIIQAFYGSFTNLSLTGPNAAHPQVVGLDNYVDLFTDPQLASSALLTLLFVLVSGVVMHNVLGMLLALLLRSGHRTVGTIVGTIVVGAWVLPEIVAAFAGYAFFSKGGTLDAFLGLFGVPEINWLYSFPMLSVIIINGWRGTAFTMLVYSAALASVPSEITEAAQVDGAGRVRTFFSVTVPMIRQTIAVNMMLIILHTLPVFTLIYVMTAGGPGTNSTTLPVLAYKQAFQFSQLGSGTAIAVIMLLIGALLSFVYIRVSRREED